jgi:hypothetical protein
MKKPFAFWLLIWILLFTACQNNGGKSDEGISVPIPQLIYTKHARCRMDCRHINETEIKEVLAENHINRQKSNLNDPRGATYAYEGETRENQHLRIIIAKGVNAWRVVTCIDLEHEFECDCK